MNPFIDWIIGCWTGMGIAMVLARGMDPELRHIGWLLLVVGSVLSVVVIFLNKALVS